MVADVSALPQCKFSIVGKEYVHVDWSHSLKLLTAAIRRLYQNLRRSYNEAQLGKECYVESQSKQRKLHSWKQRANIPFKGDFIKCMFLSCTQVYDRRKRIVKDGEEAKKWQSITCAYNMTEESNVVSLIRNAELFLHTGCKPNSALSLLAHSPEC